MNNLPDYFDYMATTPIDPRVLEKMLPYLSGPVGFGNPSSMHHYGQEARLAVEKAREQVAMVIGALPSDIVFTSGATEANNLALLGAARLYQRKGRHILSMTTEHQAVLGPLAELEKEGFTVTYLKPLSSGLISLDEFEKALTPETILVSVMHVNNEIGVIQPLSELSARLKGRGILLHVDAAQSAGKIAVNVDEMGVDLLSLSAHKNYGPKGIGALYIRSRPRVRLLPILFGGGHEKGLRPGTLPTHQIVGMGEAFQLGESLRSAEHERIWQLHRSLLEGISKLPDTSLNGHAFQRVPHNLSISFGRQIGSNLLETLPTIAASMGSACSAALHHPSYVLKALGLSSRLCLNTIRFSLGRFSTQEMVNRALIALGETYGRQLSPG